LPGSSQGRAGWPREWAIDKKYPSRLSNVDLTKTIRFWPHLSPSEGHFIALLQKNEETAGSARQVKVKRFPEMANIYKIFHQFCEKILVTPEPTFEISHLAMSGNHLYCLPVDPPDVSGLKVIRPGWWLGTLKQGHPEKGNLIRSAVRFEPAHALALGLQAENARLQVNLCSESPDITAYLRGEILSIPGDEGWILVCVDGFPIGWGKRTANEVKNHYPRHLRLR
jgi:NOL1/NOP2/fmu family ribosome biogenesis protein